MEEGLKGKVCVEWLRACSLAGPEQGGEASQGAEGQHLALLSVRATGPEGTAWRCVRGGAAGGEGKGLHQRVVGMERAAQGSGHGPEVSELMEHFDNILRN